MALKALVPTLEAVPEAMRPLYVERPDLKAFVLDVEPAEHGSSRYGLEDVGGLKSALQSERAERERLARLAADYGDLTPKAAREALERAEKLSKIDPASEAARLADERVKAHEEQFLKKLEMERKPLEERATKYRSQLEKTLKSDAIRRALIEKGAVPEDLDYLEFHASKYVDMVEQGDLLVPQVFDDNKRARISMVAGSIDPMTIDELVETVIRPKYGRHFIGDNASGSGSSQHGSTNNNGGGGVRRIPRGDQAAINANLRDIAEGKAVVV